MSKVSRSSTLFIVAAIALSVAGCAKSPPGDGETGSGGATGPTGSGGASTGSGGAGAGTGSGGGSAGPATVMKDPSTYPHNTAGAKYPFPQGHMLSKCTLPGYNTDTVAKAYNNWKTKFFQGGRVVRPSTDAGADKAYPNDTVSEGIAYGMLIGVYANDRPMFDTLWTFAKSKRDSKGFMNWRIDQSGNVVQPGGGATDADEDMAWALLMADKQWGGSYLGEATTLINAIWDNEVDQGGGNVLKPGGNFGGASLTNPSYFAPSYYRVFAKVTPSHNWMAVVESSYTILAKATGNLGLVPNWTNSNGSGVNGPGNDATVDPHFGYDACRTPFRIALDYCENGEPRAKAYLDKIVAFFAAQQATLRDGYTVTGADPSGTLGDYGAGMSIFGPGAVAAMGSTAAGQNTFLRYAQEILEQGTTGSTMPRPGVFTYYHGSWGVLALLTTSGNFWNMTE
jgi:endo-1,4-beta-D-glucanase Y